MRDVVIVGAARTPIGSFLGSLASVPGTRLGATAIKAALDAGLPQSVPCVTVNKVCGSGLEAVLGVARAIAAGDVEIGVAGGMESMSNAPHILRNSRSGTKMGPLETADTMVSDGLWDPYSNQHMG